MNRRRDRQVRVANELEPLEGTARQRLRAVDEYPAKLDLRKAGGLRKAAQPKRQALRRLESLFPFPFCLLPFRVGRLVRRQRVIGEDLVDDERRVACLAPLRQCRKLGTRQH